MWVDQETGDKVEPDEYVHMSELKSYIHISELNAYAKEKVAEINKNRETLEKAEDIYKSKGDTEKAREMERANWMREGEHVALRAVTQWAALEIISERV